MRTSPTPVGCMNATPDPLQQTSAAADRVYVPKKPTQAMRDVMDTEGWAWEDLLAAAQAITEDEYAALSTAPAQQGAVDADWLSVAEHGLPGAGEEVLAGFWYTDPWLKPEHAERFMFGTCRIFVDKKSRDFPDGKVWQTFGPSHNQITHWKRVTPPKREAISQKKVGSA